MSEKDGKKSFFDRFPLLSKLKKIKHFELIIFGVFIVILISIFFSSNSNKKTTKVENLTEFSAEQYANYLEQKLEDVIGNISGAGKVTVMITLDGGMRYEYATQTEETTTSSEVSGNTNSKVVKNEKVVIVNVNGKSTPLIVKEKYPEISGVVVVASGASNAQVKLNINRAILALIDIKDENIEILVGIN